MNFLGGLLISLASLLFGVAQAAGGPDGDTHGWETHRIVVGSKIVRFTIPPKESKEFPAFSIPSCVDLTRDGTFDQALIGPRLLQRAWDYRKSRFAAVDGSMDAYIGLRRSEQPLESLDDLKVAERESCRLFALQAYLKSGQPRASDEPAGFTPARVAGKDGLKASYERSSSAYLVPLDAHTYLKIAVEIGGITVPQWRIDAKAAAAAILESIHIEEAGTPASR